MGIVILVILSKLFSVQILPIHIVSAITFVLLPDLDMLFEAVGIILKKVKFGDIHRTYTHFPLLYLPAIVVTFILNPFTGVLFFLCIIWHFLHDSFGTAWGVQWLWPVNNTYYKFFSDEKGVISGNFVQKWTPEQNYIVAKTYGDTHWMENIYINSWTLKNIKTTGSGPSMKYLVHAYKKVRWMFYSEIILTLASMVILSQLICNLY